MPVLGLKLQLSPARHELAAQFQSVAEAFGRVQGLVRGLAIEIQDTGKDQNKIGTLLQRHLGTSQSDPGPMA